MIYEKRLESYLGHSEKDEVTRVRDRFNLDDSWHLVHIEKKWREDFLWLQFMNAPGEEMKLKVAVWTVAIGDEAE